jgi:hypothetical protein
MSLENFAPSIEYKKFEEQHGEDTFIDLNLLYIAFEINDIREEKNPKDEEFDELCADILEMYLDDRFDSFNVVDVADGVDFIIKDSNYSIKEYILRYKRDKDQMCEELLAYLNKQRKIAAQGD